MRRATVLCVVLLGVSACGSGAKTFDEQRLKFEYPSGFRAGKAVGAAPPGQVVGIVGVGKDDYIAVRARSGGALPLARLKTTLPSVVMGVVPATVKTERNSGLEMLTAVQRLESGVEARISFFNEGGRTWEIECRSTEAKRDYIGSACAKALQSIRIG